MVSKEQARDGPMLYPSVTWNNVKHGFICPKCGKIITRIIDGISLKVGADFFVNQTSQNHKCPFCKEPLWSVYNPYSTTWNEWIRIGEYGYVHRRFAYRDLEIMKDERIRKKIRYVLDHPSEYIPTVNGYRKYPLSAYIKRRIPKVDGVIIDELHQYSGESAQGQAMAELAQKAEKVIGMTATLLNGYAKGMFYLLFRLKPRLILMDGHTYHKSNTFCSEYGVTEYTTTIPKETAYNVKSKGQRKQTRTKFKPGISPLIYCRFLLENAAFLSLADMGKELPEYEEIPVACSVLSNIMSVYEKIESDLKSIMRKDMQLGNKLLSTFLNLLSAYPDQPYGHEPIYHPFIEKREPLLKVPDMASPNDILPKDAMTLKIVEEKVKAGERVIIYTAWTRLDTRDKLKKLLTEKGYRVSILDTSIPARKREKWVDDKVREGIDVLIVNPALVETGLDLIAFTTLIFYNTAYNLYIFRQASRRSWRINQTAPRVEVYILYYSNTIQERALTLMASKLAAATAIEGDISDEGLAAMSDCEDMMGELARQLVAEIKDEVDDLSSSFRKMAILHTDSAGQNSKKINPISEPVYAFQKQDEEAEINSNTDLKADNILCFIKPKRRHKKAPENFEETGQVNIMDLLVS